jgi:hypothetical protein
MENFLSEALTGVLFNTWPILLLFGIIVSVGTALKFGASATRDSKSPYKRFTQPITPAANSLPVHQLDAISAVEFQTIPLLNREEARLLPLLEKFVSDHALGCRVMAQVSIPEIVKAVSTSKDRSAQDRAFRAINAKRIDFGIFDGSGRIVVAIEYQGTGHYQNRAVVRDAVKREVFRKAGVCFLEIMPETPFDQVAGQLVREFQRIQSR